MVQEPAPAAKRRIVEARALEADSGEYLEQYKDFAGGFSPSEPGGSLQMVDEVQGGRDS